MIGGIKAPELPGVEITAVAHEGLRVMAGDAPARLAVVDTAGRVIAAGDDVAKAAMAASVACYRGFLLGKGHLRVDGKESDA